MKIEIPVQGMVCDGCTQAVKRAFEGVDGVSAVEPSFETDVVAFEFDNKVASVDHLKTLIKQAGFDV